MTVHQQVVWAQSGVTVHLYQKEHGEVVWASDQEDSQVCPPLEVFWACSPGVDSELPVRISCCLEHLHQEEEGRLGHPPEHAATMNRQVSGR